MMMYVAVEPNQTAEKARTVVVVPMAAAEPNLAAEKVQTVLVVPIADRERERERMYVSKNVYTLF